jgi:hypothetical protein
MIKRNHLLFRSAAFRPTLQRVTLWQRLKDFARRVLLRRTSMRD